MWSKIILVLLLSLVFIYLGLRILGGYRWAERTQQFVADLEKEQQNPEHRAVDFAELEGLPAPVARYLRKVLREGQPLIQRAFIRHTGTFNMGKRPDAPNWRPFSSQQWVITRRPGFVWDAQVGVMPGLPARVHDGYVGGKGVLYGAILGLFPVVDLQDGEEMARAELMRFLGEAAWYPTALLPHSGIDWEEVDEHSARATLRDGEVSASMRFTFGEDDLLHSIFVEDRPRSVDNPAEGETGTQTVPTPWRGTLTDYVQQDGMWIPRGGEIAWILPEGEMPYWRGYMDTIEFSWVSAK